MKKIHLLILMLLIAGGINAQEFKASYTYDANGNRESATVIYLSLKSAKMDSTELDSTEQDIVDLELNKEKEDSEEQLNELKDYSVKIYPNPTQSDLLIQINVDKVAKAGIGETSVKVLSLSGQTMAEVNQVASYNTIDMSQFKDGTYIVVLKINGAVKTYKIIKN